MSHDSSILLLGHVSGLYGVRGWVRVHSYTAPITNILKHRDCWLALPGATGEPAPADWQPARLISGRRQGKGLVAQFAVGEAGAIEDRDLAAGWIGARIGVSRQALPRPGRDEIYLADLVGMAVENEDGDALGEIIDVMDTGAHPVLAIERDGQSLLIPFVRDVYVLDIDLAGRCLTVHWQPDY
jgi:16S rRNA processing protein RimM